MQWFIISRDMHVLCAPSSYSPDSLPIFNDKQTILINNNTVVSTYEFTIQQKHPDAKYLQMGNYIAFKDKYDDYKLYTLKAHSGNDLQQTWTAEDIGMDLINATADKWDYSKNPHPIEWYLTNKVLVGTAWKIGVNEIPSLSRGLSFDGQSDTLLTRAGDIANQFDGAEISFTITMNGGQVTSQLLNIYKKIGNGRTQEKFIDALNLKSLNHSGDIDNLCTSLILYGGTPENTNDNNNSEQQPIDIKNVKYDDGQFFSPVGDIHLYDRVSHKQWSRFGSFTGNYKETEGYINGIYTYDTVDTSELIKRGITELKSRNHPTELYEASLLELEANIGDYVQIAHKNYNPPIYLSARVQQVENCYTAEGEDTGILGDYTRLQSSVDPRVQNMIDSIANKMKFNYTWIRYASDDKGTNMTSVPTSETKYVAILPNKQNGVPSDNPADYAEHWQLIKGSDGKDGIPGATGADGKTSYTHFAYADNVSGTADFSLDDPTGRSYMGVYSDFTKADSTNPDDYIWSLTKGESGPEGMQGAQGPKGDIGIPGKPGVDGKTSYTHVAYANNDEGGGFGQNPTNKAYMGWYSDFTANDSTDTTKYAWSLIKGSDGLDGAQGIPGPKGADGKTPYTHIAYADTATGGGLSQLPDGKKYIGMYVDFTENDSSDPQKYAWSLIKGADGKDGTPGKDGIAGKDGIGIKSTTVTYQASSNGTDAPTGAWTANVPTVPAGQYLWTRTIWTYTDNTNETSYSVAYVAKDGNSGKDGIAGKDGVGIKSTTITYATSTSGTVTPATGWVTNPPAVSPGQFMWTKTVWNYTDNSSETGYSVAQAGKTGATGPVGKDGIAGKDGVGIKSTAIAYAQSTSGTTPPTTGWIAGVPTLIKGQYLWTKTVWTYTDSSAETGYTVSYNAKDGNTGADGIAGKDGVGIKSTIIEYVGAVSGTSNPVSGWSTTIPTVPAGQYLWTRTTWKYTDGTSEQGFTNALMGRTGAKGDTGAQGLQGIQGPTGTQGIAGPKGADGKTQYTHIAYANSANGVTNFSTSDSNRTYIGMYVDFNVNDSTTPGDYSWTLVKGADGSQGTPGKAGTDGKTPYLHTAYSWSADGTNRFTAVYPEENLLTDTGSHTVTGKANNDYLSNETNKDFLTIFKGLEGKTVTISVDYEYSGFVAGSSQNRLGWETRIVTDSTVYFGPWYYPKNDSGSGRMSSTFVVPKNITEIGYANGYIQFSGTGTGTLSHLKLEKGSVATPYTPSPLDDPEGAYPKFIGTYTDYTADDSTDPSKYTWAKLRGEQGPKGDTGEDGVAGKDGVGIKSTQIMYAQSASGTTAPTTGWTAQVPALIKGQYLWTQTTWLYTDSTGEAGYTVSYNAKDGNTGANGIAGKDGVGIKSTVIEYVVSSNGVTKPSTGWLTTIPSVAPGQFLWTRTTWRYTDNTNEVGYSVAQAGATGPKGDKGNSGTDGVAGKDGIGIKSTAITYALGDSGTVAPTTGWTTSVPSLVKGKYLWTKTVWLYTDNTSESGYSTTYIGKDGNDGNNGLAGKDGVGIKSTKVEYAGSTSGTNKPTNGWLTTVPSVASGSFLWTKTTWSYTDGTSESGYSVAKMGEKGAQGPQGLQGLQGATGNQGIQGPKGLDGKSSYTHIAYGTSNSGAGFTQTPSTSTTYIGMYVDQTATDSTNPSSYKWSLIKGADGTQGTPGTKGADGKTPYFHSAWANSVDGKTGFSTTDSVNKSYLGTYTDFTQGDSADPTKYAWSLIKGADGVNGKDGIPGKPGADGRTPYFHTAWADSMDGKINFSLTDATNRGYLGTYTDFTQADSTDTTKYAWSLIKGRDGSDGAPGKAGTDGKTPYFHQAWADSKDGKVSFSTTDPTNRGYLGTYSDFTQADSNDPTKYFWVELVGALEIGGRNLLRNSRGKFQPNKSTTDNYEIYDSMGVSVYMTQGQQYTVHANAGSGLIWSGRHNPAEESNNVVLWLVDNANVNAIISDTNTGTGTTFTWNNPSGTYYLRVNTYKSDNSGYVENVKVEKGNMSTDWSPAPEDTQGQIDKVNNGLEHVEGLYNSILTPIASVTAPTNPKNGQQWWVLDANSKTTGFKIWTGSAWKDATIQQSAMNIDTLNGNTINGATINTSDFNMSFDQTNAIYDANKKGTMTIKNGEIKTDFQIKDTTQTGHVYLTPEGLSTGSTNHDGTRQNAVNLAFGQINLTTTVNTPSGGSRLVQGSLNAEDMEKSLTTYWESGDAGSRQKFWMYKQFRRVVLTGVILLPASKFGTGGNGYRTIFNITDTSLRPLTTRWVKCSSFGDVPHLGLLEFRPNGDVVAIGVPSQGRYSFEGESYAIENL